jgi:folate-binding protein YgfZ
MSLIDIQRADGAAFATFDGQELPVRFAAVADEWSAVRRGSGLLDAGFRRFWRLIGADRVSFLQGMVSNDVAILNPGEGTYAAFLTQQGRVVSDLRIYVTADAVWLDVPVSRMMAVREGLERFIIADDVEFAEPAPVPLVVVEGPHAPRTLLSIIGDSLEGLAPYAHREVIFDGTPVSVIVASHTGERGFLIVGDPAIGGRLWERCRAAGAAPVGMEALDILRVEAGIPWCGRDMDESVLISEVGLEAAISFRKGCYLGQEVVERVAARGQVQRKLVGLLCEGSTVPPAGTKLLRDAAEVGWITSAVHSPWKQAAIALGYARRESWAPGSELSIAGGSSAHVVELPFYRRE